MESEAGRLLCVEWRSEDRDNAIWMLIVVTMVASTLFDQALAVLYVSPSRSFIFARFRTDFPCNHAVYTF